MYSTVVATVLVLDGNTRLHRTNPRHTSDSTRTVLANTGIWFGLVRAVEPYRTEGAMNPRTGLGVGLWGPVRYRTVVAFGSGTVPVVVGFCSFSGERFHRQNTEPI